MWLNCDILKLIFHLWHAFVMSNCMHKPLWLSQISVAALVNQTVALNVSDKLSDDRLLMPIGPSEPSNDVSELLFRRCFNLRLSTYFHYGMSINKVSSTTQPGMV